MNDRIVGHTISAAWLSAIQHLLSNSGSSYNLVIEINDPQSENLTVRAELDALLRIKDQVTETVANTIFPKALYNSSFVRDTLYESYFSIYPRIRKVGENNRGTYFGRMVAWQNVCEVGITNQLETAISKFSSHKKNCLDEQMTRTISIYNPTTDGNNLMGFPCMSVFMLQNTGQELNLTAYYRNQYFVKKAYGNYLGLARLLNYVCQESGYVRGKLTCIATHATLESGYSKQLRNIVNKFRNEITEASEI